MRALPVVLVVLAGCAAFSSSDDRADDQAGADDGGADADAPTTFFELADKERWSTFAIHRELSSELSGFFGAAFDGRYLYLAPHGSPLKPNGPSVNSGRALRYDTTKPFARGDGWVDFDAGVFAPNLSTQHRGAIVAKDRVFYVPGTVNGQAPPPAYLLAHPSGESTPFAAPSSWTAQNLYSPERNRFGYFGGAFDGRYLYFAPAEFVPSSSDLRTRITRYDTRLGMANPSAYADIDVVTVPNGYRAQQFAGAAFDGRHVYFVPSTGSEVRRIARFDTNAEWVEPSLEHYDLGEVDPTRTRFCGAVFDGRYLYLPPQSVGNEPYGSLPASKALRFDTTLPIGQKASWESFDLSNVSPGATGFCGGQFDGRYVYFAPTQWLVGATPGGATLVRFDTTKSAFDDASAWGSVDLQPQIGEGQIAGSAFDGKYLYLVPRTGGKLLRFDARSTRGLPKLDKGVASFF